MYLPVFLLKFQLGELVGCGIKFRIQRVPTQHTFDKPRYPKNKNHHVFQIFLVFGVAGSIKSMPSGYSWDAEFNSASNELFRLKFLVKTRGDLSKIETKVVFFFSSSKINKYYFIILLIFLGGPF